MDTKTIRYCFKLGNDTSEVFDVELDARTFELQGTVPEELPAWTRLDFYQCPHCPLSVAAHPHCPAAANLVNIVNRFDSLFSYTQTHLIVTTEDRIISQVTTMQRAVSSLVGLVIATCGCPQSAYFRPMAAFHLPLASNRETTYRGVAMYFMAQYFRKAAGKPIDFELGGLKEIYKNIRLVNRTLADRLRAAARSDSVLNAIVQLDIYAQTLVSVVEDSLEELRCLFEPYLKTP
ncbi:MAG: hypothetical protein GY950_22445 [bacterium]|nr:hypothetical protein [bacterium]